MKTLRLTRAESAAYANGERRIGRAMRKQPRVGIRGDGSIIDPEYLVWEDKGDIIPLTPSCMYRIPPRCPYGQPGDLVKLSGGEVVEGVFMIAKITVEQRDGRWGWVVEVGA
jgi:hypothetical protein